MSAERASLPLQYLRRRAQAFAARALWRAHGLVGFVPWPLSGRRLRLRLVVEGVGWPDRVAPKLRRRAIALMQQVVADAA